METEIAGFTDETELSALSREAQNYSVAAESNISRALATIRNAWKERDEARALNRRIMCSYCGHTETMPEGGDFDTLKAIIVNHVNECQSHPLNQAAKLIEPYTTALLRLHNASHQMRLALALDEAGPSPEVMSEFRAANGLAATVLDIKPDGWLPGDLDAGGVSEG